LQPDAGQVAVAQASLPEQQLVVQLAAASQVIDPLASQASSPSHSMAQVAEVQVTPLRQAVEPSQSTVHDTEAVHETPISQARVPWQRMSH